MGIYTEYYGKLKNRLFYLRSATFEMCGVTKLNCLILELFNEVF